MKARELLQTSISSRNTESFDLEKTDCVGSEITEQLIWNAYDEIGISPILFVPNLCDSCGIARVNIRAFSHGFTTY